MWRQWQTQSRSEQGKIALEEHVVSRAEPLKERVHSETKIMDKIKLDQNIMPFIFFFSKSVSIPSDINSSLKISLPGPALSLAGTCIIASEDLHIFD